MTIDFWTLGIQAVNVLILVFLLQHFFWRPVAAIIAKRQADADALIDDVKTKQQAAEAALKQAEETRAGFAAEREAVLVAARSDAEAARQAALAAARHEAEALQQSALTTIAREREEAKKIQADEATQLAITIAARLASRLDGAAVREAFLDWLFAEIAAMAPETRRSLTRGDRATLQLTSASELAPEDQSRIAARIATAFAANPEITFRADPALIAGFELHSPFFTLRNSWRADLDRIAGDLSHDN